MKPYLKAEEITREIKEKLPVIDERPSENIIVQSVCIMQEGLIRSRVVCSASVPGIRKRNISRRY